MSLKIPPKFCSYILPCTVFITLCLVIAAFSGAVSETHIEGWFVQLNKPSFNPPAWLFAPVWTVLYILIGLSGGILWQYRKIVPKLFYYYLLQLIFNFAWSFIFFVNQQIGAALIDMLLLIVFVSLTIFYAWLKVRIVSYLLAPYWLWLCFALLLNFSIWLLN